MSGEIAPISDFEVKVGYEAYRHTLDTLYDKYGVSRRRVELAIRAALEAVILARHDAPLEKTAI